MNPSDRVPVPDTMRAMYAVMTALPIAPEPEDFEVPPAGLLRLFGTSDEALARLAERTCARTVVRSSPFGDVAAFQRDVRVETLREAERHDGVVIDLLIPRTVEQPSSDVDLSDASQWISFDLSDTETVRTRGLDGFGLPEVTCARRGPDTSMVTAVVSGLAHRLIAEWPDHDPVGPATITLRDVAYGLGDAAAARVPRDRRVDVRIDFDANAHELRLDLDTDPATALFG